MTGWLGSKALIGGAVLWMALTSGNPAISATTQRSTAARGTVLPTISVASLRIPRKAWKHYQRAREAARNSREEEFVREAAKALEIQPAFAEVYLLRAEQALSQLHCDAAIENVLIAQRIDPGVHWGSIILAAAYNSLKRYNDAFLVLDHLSGAEAETWQAKYEMARAAVGLGDVEGALRWSGLALKAPIDDCPDAHLLRANALQLAHRWKEASAQMEMYLASNQPQVHRAEVLSALVRTKVAAAQKELAEQDASASGFACPSCSRTASLHQP